MKYTVRKSTIAAENPGYSGGANNCRYRGNSPLWVVEDESGNTAHECKTKREAVEICDFANRIEYAGIGDLALLYYKANFGK